MILFLYALDKRFTKIKAFIKYLYIIGEYLNVVVFIFKHIKRILQNNLEFYKKNKNFDKKY